MWKDVWQNNVWSGLKFHVASWRTSLLWQASIFCPYSTVAGNSDIHLFLIDAVLVCPLLWNKKSEFWQCFAQVGPFSHHSQAYILKRQKEQEFELGIKEQNDKVGAKWAIYISSDSWRGEKRKVQLLGSGKNRLLSPTANRDMLSGTIFWCQGKHWKRFFRVGWNLTGFEHNKPKSVCMYIWVRRFVH